MLSWVYPVTCELCGEESEYALCPQCLEGLPHVPRPICLYCGSPVAGEQEDPYCCDACRNKPRTFDFARSALLRSETTMELVHQFKYHKAVYLAAGFAPALAGLWENTPALQAHDDWALVPVPVTPPRLFQLGYNHAGELATALGKLMGLRVIPALQRQEQVKGSQTRLSATSRMQHAFDIYQPAPSYAEGRRSLPPHLLIIDDVYTTGATTRACAKALKSLPGVQSVGALTLLRIEK